MTGGGGIWGAGGAMVTLDGSFTVSAGVAGLPPCGPTSASAFALSSGDTESLPACDAAGMLLALLSDFMLLAISMPPTMAAPIRASTAHLIQVLLLRAGSCGKAGGLPWRAGKMGALTGALTGVWTAADAAGGAACQSMGSISGGSVRAIDVTGAACVSGTAVTAGMAKAAGAVVAMGAAIAEAACSGVAAALSPNTVPHWGQNLACGLHTAWQPPQIFSTGAVSAADVSFLAPQFLQNLALGVSGLLHCEQFIVCNR